MPEAILVNTTRGFHGVIIKQSVTFGLDSGNDICIAGGGVTKALLNPVSTDLLKLTPGAAYIGGGRCHQHAFLGDSGSPTHRAAECLVSGGWRMGREDSKENHGPWDVLK